MNRFAIVSPPDHQPARRRFYGVRLWWFACGLSCALATVASSIPDEVAGWQAAIIEAQTEAVGLAHDREALGALAERLSIRLERESPVAWDWCLQDVGSDFTPWLTASTFRGTAQTAAARVLAELGTAGEELRREFDGLVNGAEPAEPGRWLEVYGRAAEMRREHRLGGLRRAYPEWVFTRHHTLGGSHYAYTEGQSDAQHERQFQPGAALMRLSLAGASAEVRTLIEDPAGVIRDPDVSWDGRCVLFAWKQSDREDDYHLYELEVGSGRVKQLTHGLGFADYEGVYLSNDELLFNSTRCVQTVDCWWTEVSNLYTCARDGRFLRRLTFDQVHDNYPTVLPDGRVVYTRWEYNDRGQIFVQGLFQMNPDGTGQTEFYGNNSWFPTALLHARGIPGTGKVVAIFSGHHTRQVGQLGIVDPALGRQENAGARLIAPVRETPAERIDAYGQEGMLFQYPYPLSESEFVVTAAPLGWSRSPPRFKLYWMAADGRRELLVADPDISCNQAVPLAARCRPIARSAATNTGRTNAVCYLQDIYVGPGLAGVARGTIRKLRVVGLEYRAAGIGWNYNGGTAGAALVSTPVSIGNGSWDVKVVLGEARVYPDGSACFTVPARVPLYFQPIDAQGCAVQTMRSWVTLQPGEYASCVGCHESKNSSPRPSAPSLAFLAGPRELTPFHGPPRGFSFQREIQPILDRHCVRCHHDESKWEERLGLELGPAAVAAGSRSGEGDAEVAFTLRDKLVTEELAKRHWTASYLALVHATERWLDGTGYLAGTPNALVNWISAQSDPTLLPPYAAGSARSGLLAMLAAGHHDVRLGSDETEKLAGWIDLLVPFCGDYQEAHAWTLEEQEKYRHFLEKRRGMEELERLSLRGNR